MDWACDASGAASSKERRTRGESSSSTDMTVKAVDARWAVGKGISRVLCRVSAFFPASPSAAGSHYLHFARELVRSILGLGRRRHVRCLSLAMATSAKASLGVGSAVSRIPTIDAKPPVSSLGRPSPAIPKPFFPSQRRGGRTRAPPPPIA